MNYSKLEYFTSKPRLNRYFKACGYSKDLALELYEVNVKVSQAFYPILNLFEVFLRNSINQTLTSHFDDSDWIINQKSGFMIDPSLGSNIKLYKDVEEAQNYLSRKNIRITSGKIIAEQSLSFWTRLFDPDYYRLVEGCLIHTFPERPPKVRRNRIKNKLDNIRIFRNRVYHNEPICFKNNTVSFDKAKSIKSNILNLLEWMDNDIYKYVTKFNSVDFEIEKGERLF